MSELATIESVGTAVAATTSLPALDYSARLGMWLAAAESNSNDPKAKGMAAALRIEYARLLDLPPHAAQEIHVIKGNLTLSAKLCRALAHNHGLRVTKVEETPASATAAVVDVRTGKELGRYTYTVEMAKKAGLSGDNWSKVPDRMCWARASKRVLDDFAPWVTTGVMTVEEAEDAGNVVPVPFDSDEVLVGEVVHESSAEEPSGDASSGNVTDSVASESSSAGTFTEKARKAGLVQEELA